MQSSFLQICLHKTKCSTVLVASNLIHIRHNFIAETINREFQCAKNVSVGFYLLIFYVNADLLFRLDDTVLGFIHLVRHRHAGEEETFWAFWVEKCERTVTYLMDKLQKILYLLCHFFTSSYVKTTESALVLLVNEKKSNIACTLSRRSAIEATLFINGLRTLGCFLLKQQIDFQFNFITKIETDTETISR